MKTFKEFIKLQESVKNWEISKKRVLEWDDDKEYFWVKKDDKSFTGVFNNTSLDFDDIAKVKQYIDKNFTIPVGIWNQFVKLTE